MPRKTMALLEERITAAIRCLPWSQRGIWLNALRGGQSLTPTDQATLLNGMTHMEAALKGEAVYPILLVPVPPEAPAPILAPDESVNLDELLARVCLHPERSGVTMSPRWLGNDTMRPYTPPYLGVSLRVPLDLYREHLVPYRDALMRGHVTFLGQPYVLYSSSFLLNLPGVGLPMLADRAMTWDLKPLALWDGLLGFWLPGVGEAS